MTLKQSMFLMCMGYNLCDDCPIIRICEKFRDEDDPYETIGDMDDDFVKTIARDAKAMAEKILYHVNCCDSEKKSTT